MEPETAHVQDTVGYLKVSKLEFFSDREAPQVFSKKDQFEEHRQIPYDSRGVGAAHRGTEAVENVASPSLHRLDFGGAACCVHHTHASLLLDGSGSRRTSRRARTAGLSRSTAARSNTAAPGPHDLPRRGGPPGVLLLRCTLAHLFYSSHIFFLTGSSLPFFFLTSMQCSAVQCRCAQHRCTAVSACTQPCWCAAGRNEAAAASPLPSPLPFLFFSRPHSSVAYRTQLQRCTIGARTTTLHQLCSSTIAAYVS